jgi:hypothetical protein
MRSFCQGMPPARPLDRAGIPGGWSRNTWFISLPISYTTRMLAQEVIEKKKHYKQSSTELYQSLGNETETSIIFKEKLITMVYIK